MYSNIVFITYNFFLFRYYTKYLTIIPLRFFIYQNQEYYITMLYSNYLIINSFDFITKNVESCQSSLHFTQRYFKQIIEKKFLKVTLHKLGILWSKLYDLFLSNPLIDFLYLCCGLKFLEVK